MLDKICDFTVGVLAGKDISFRYQVPICTGLLMIALGLWFGRKEEVRVSSLPRPEAGGGAEDTRLEIGIKGEETWTWQGELAARIYSEEELDAHMKQAVDHIREQLPREGESLDRVMTGINLTKEVRESGVSVTWSWEEKELLDREGNVCQEALKEETILELTAELTCQDRKDRVVIPILLEPEELTEEERYQRDLEDELRKQAGSQDINVCWELPTHWEGKELAFYQVKEKNWWVLPLLLVGVILFRQAHQREEIRTREKERKEQILQQYPQFVSRFVVLLGAGMNLSSVWKRLAGEEGPIYQEAYQVVIRLQNGEPERYVYEEFGKRTGVQECQRFAAILTQNLRMGSERILEQLEYEAANALEERKARARRRGEEMGTKLLLPMMLQLLLILALVMIPAFLLM